MASEEVETKSIITGLLTSNPLRCTMQQLCADFYNTVGYNIPFRKLGFMNAEAYLRSIPDTVQIIGCGPSAEVRGVLKEKSLHINVMVAKQKKDSIPAHKRKNVKILPKLNSLVSKQLSHSTTKNNFNSCGSSSYNTKQSVQLSRYQELPIYEDEYCSKVPKSTQNNLRKLVMRFPDGIWCRKLPEEYRKMFEENLDYKKYNYRSLIEMCSALPEIFHYIQPSLDDFILYDKAKAIPSLNQNDLIKTENTDTGSAEIDWSLGSDLFPTDVVQFLEKIPRLDLDELNVSDYLDIQIREIHDIDSFWIYPKYGGIEKLTTELGEFFCKERNRYTIPKLFLEEGLYCTVFYKNNYHRCVISDLLPTSPDFVKVLFIDYGAIRKICTNEIWYLPKQFGSFPCQAIEARLSHIRPTVDTQTCNKFRELTSRAELVAQMTKIDKKSLLVEIYLANVTDENNIFYVNDALVEKGYAKYI